MSTARHQRSMMGRVGNFMRGIGRTIEFSREANAIAMTPESVFRARGTTRDAALRDLLSRL